MKSRNSIVLIIILGILLIAGCGGCNAYNSLVKTDQGVKKAWSNVETNYQRRTDLYNSVIKTIEGSANFEKSTLREVLEARSKATSVNVNLDDPKSLQAYQQAQASLQTSMGRLLAVVENYPDLKTTKAFQDFQAQIEGTENRINVARRDFNAEVERYNLLVKTFPQNIFAGIFRFKEKPYYEADPGTNRPPNINFNIK